MFPSHLFPGDKSDWLPPALVVCNKRNAYPNVHFFACISNVVIIVFLELCISIVFVGSAFLLYLWAVYLYCICVQCICVVFVLYLWAVVPINWPAHLSSLPTQASIFARSLNLNLQFQRLILSNRKIICKISNR